MCEDLLTDAKPASLVQPPFMRFQRLCLTLVNLHMVRRLAACRRTGGPLGISVSSLSMLEGYRTIRPACLGGVPNAEGHEGLERRRRVRWHVPAGPNDLVQGRPLGVSEA